MKFKEIGNWTENEVLKICGYLNKQLLMPYESIKVIFFSKNSEKICAGSLKKKISCGTHTTFSCPTLQQMNILLSALHSINKYRRAFNLRFQKASLKQDGGRR